MGWPVTRSAGQAPQITQGCSPYESSRKKVATSKQTMSILPTITASRFQDKTAEEDLYGTLKGAEG